MRPHRETSRKSTSASPRRPTFTPDMIRAALKEAEPGVAELSKKLKEKASRSEIIASLRFR